MELAGMQGHAGCRDAPSPTTSLRGVSKPLAPCCSHTSQPDILDSAGSRCGGFSAYTQGKTLAALPTPASPAGGELNPVLELEPHLVSLFSSSFFHLLL